MLRPTVPAAQFEDYGFKQCKRKQYGNRYYLCVARGCGMLFVSDVCFDVFGYEIGKTHPSLGNVIKIAEALKCTFGWDRSKIWFSKAKKKKPKKHTDQDYVFDLFY